MKIEMPIDELQHIAEYSVYNSNYYLLPVSIDGRNIIHTSYDGGDNFNGHRIGNLINGELANVLYLNTDVLDDWIEIDSTRISEKNLYT